MPDTLKQQTLPDLAYDYSALEPAISGKIMELHHTKHHQTYINNYNALAEKYEAAKAKDDIAAMLALQPGLNFNGGGHVNHTLFWENLAPQNQGGGVPPTGPLADALNTQWGSLDAFIENFNNTTTPIQGSGWGWLGYCPQNKRLEIATCANQNPLSTKGLIPLLGVDVWEHAYYLQYFAARPAYLKAIWQVINWKKVAKRYQVAI